MTFKLIDSLLGDTDGISERFLTHIALFSQVDRAIALAFLLPQKHFLKGLILIQLMFSVPRDW